MGIDYTIKSSDASISIYAENDPDVYLKYAWRDIEWDKIFECLHINLNLLYDHAINYWSVEQVKDMRDLIKKFYEYDESLLFDEERMSSAKKYHDDAGKLLEFFNFYVDNKMYIFVF